MFDISPIQIIIVLAIALLIFGPKRLPEMGRSIGRGVRDFKDGLTNDTRDEAGVQSPVAPATIVAQGTEHEPSVEEIVKENVTPDPVDDEAAPRAAPRS